MRSGGTPERIPHSSDIQQIASATALVLMLAACSGQESASEPETEKRVVYFTRETADRIRQGRGESRTYVACPDQ